MSLTIPKILCLLFLSVLLSAELIPLDTNTIEQIFKQKKGGLLLLLGDDETESLAFGSFARFVFSTPLQIITAVSRSHDALFKQVVKHLGVEPDQTPHIIYINEEGARFKFDSQLQFNPDNIQEFFNKAHNGQLPEFIKSQPKPTNINGYVVTLVASDFEELVLNSQKEVLVKFYAPWCHHCKVMAAEYQKLARLMSVNPNIMIAQLDASANQVRTVAIQGYPTLKWWGKDKSQPSKEYHGSRKAEDFINFLRRNTEYEWVQLQTDIQYENKEGLSDWQM